jgi:putative chitinase
MLLKNGDNNEDVKKLQSKLGLIPDGIFGSNTEAAVREYQKKNRLDIDGMVGTSTWNTLMSSVKPTTNGLNLDKLKGHIPQIVIDSIPAVADKFGINTPLRIAHFLAQCGHESGGFRVTSENLNYSTKGLLGTFKKYFPTEALASQYQRNPQKIANKVYANRMANGNEASGEGYKFRGRGYIQLTGKDNYTQFGKSIGEDMVANPDKVASTYALLSAAWFFSNNGLHRIADEGASDTVVTKITRRVNGGTIGLADRITHFKEYYSLLV